MAQTRQMTPAVLQITGWRLALVCALLFLCLFACYAAMLPAGEFMDEVDVFSGGYLVSRGCDVYDENMTQHMPFSYYFAAIPALLGARTTNAFRLMFYAMLSLLWVGQFLHQRRELPTLLLLALPFLYLAQLRVVSLGASMVSDHWCGMGIAFLLLEALRYDRSGRIGLSSAVWISFDIVLSLGTAFVAAYAVAAVFLCVCVMQAGFLRRAGKADRGRILREDLRLVGVCLAPFALLIGWYLVSGNLTRAFEGAYLINTTVYSKYMDGYGSSASGAFVQMLRGFVLAPADALRGLSLAALTSHGFTLARYAALLGCAAGLCAQKRPMPAATILAAAAMSGARGFEADNFHAMAFYCVCALCMAWCVNETVCAFLRRRSWRRGVYALAVCGLAAAVLAPTGLGLARAAGAVPRQLQRERADDRLAAIVRLLEEKDERVQNADIGTGTLFYRAEMCTGRYSGAATTPWTWEYYGDKQLREIRDRQTRLVFYTPGNEVWGCAEDEYAAELVAYLRQNYRQLYTSLWVRSDAYPEALQKVRQAGLFIGRTGNDLGTGDRVSDMLAPGEELVQHFAAEGGRCIAAEVRMGNYGYRNLAGVTFRLLDDRTGEELASARVAAEEIQDNAWVSARMDAALEKGRGYALHVTIDEPPAGRPSALAVYLSGHTDAQTWAERSGLPMAGSLAMRLFYQITEN